MTPAPAEQPASSAKMSGSADRLDFTFVILPPHAASTPTCGNRLKGCDASIAVGRVEVALTYRALSWQIACEQRRFG
jgi:hypothetical protein